MKTPNTIEDEIDRIRLAIYEETKDLTVAQYVERTNRIGEVIAKQYGLKIVPGVKRGWDGKFVAPRSPTAKRQEVLV